MVDLPVDPKLSPASRRRTLLRAGRDEGWWLYESENPAGWSRQGVTYDAVTYLLVLPAEPEEDLPEREVVLLASEVEGFVLATALRYDQTSQIAYRPGLLPPAPTTSP